MKHATTKIRGTPQGVAGRGMQNMTATFFKTIDGNTGGAFRARPPA